MANRPMKILVKCPYEGCQSIIDVVKYIKVPERTEEVDSRLLINQ